MLKQILRLCICLAKKSSVTAAEWSGESGGWPELTDLALGNNALTGELPAGWADAFPNLQYLWVFNTRINSTLPVGEPLAQVHCGISADYCC